MKYLKNTGIVTLLIFIGITLGWWSKYEYEKVECIRDHDNYYLLKKETSKQSSIQTKISTDKAEDSRCETIISRIPLVVQYAQNDSVNCDSAYTNLELNFCSGTKACLERKKLDSLNNILLTIYDSLVNEQNEEIKQWTEKGDSSMLKFVTDYKLIRKLHNQSIIKFLEYADLEMAIKGAEVGTGRLRTSYENYRWIEILQTKNLELEKLIKEYEE